jgi:NADPH-dependent ferric siderophore reductase
MTHLESTSQLSWNPSPEHVVLLAGTDRDIPTIALLLSTLPATARGQVFIETDVVGESASLEAPGRFTVTWLDRSRGQQLRRSVNAWLSEMLPTSAFAEHSVYAWVAADGPARVLSSN